MSPTNVRESISLTVGLSFAGVALVALILELAGSTAYWTKVFGMPLMLTLGLLAFKLAQRHHQLQPRDEALEEMAVEAREEMAVP